MHLRVEAHAGFKAAERPIRFWIGDQEYGVEEILDRWYGPDHEFFKLRASDGNLYILRHDPYCHGEESWSLTSFRRV